MPIRIVLALALIAAVMLAGDVIAVRACLARLIDRHVAAFQEDLMRRHTEEVQNIYREMRGWRHDFHNHIQTMKAFRALGQEERLGSYLEDLDRDLTDVDKIVKSGNVMVDAILNSKLSLARSRKIAVNAKAVVPERLRVADVDLCIILGNLLDNAIEACMKLKDEKDRLLRVYVDVKRDRLYVSVTNTSGGSVKKRGGRYQSAKQGFHGLGLMRVDRLVDRYQGYVKRRDEQGAFTTELLLPL